MKFPPWADEQISQELPVLRSRGEGQTIEYKESFPSQARDLGKEIAAFATSGSGIILLGITDTGDLKGLENMDQAKERDKLIQRVQGICSGTVNPPITPKTSFAIEDGKTILIITVPKGPEPVYYCAEKPYVRHITESRPATPDEVKTLFKKWLDRRREGVDEEDTEESDFRSHLARSLFPILIYGEEVEERDSGIILDSLMAKFKGATFRLRDIASSEMAIKLGLPETLEELANKADQISTFTHALGKSEKFTKLVQDAVDQAKNIKQSYIDNYPIPEKKREEIIKYIGNTNRFLHGLSERTIELGKNGRIYEVQQEAEQKGYWLLSWGLLNLDPVPKELRQELIDMAREIHLINTIHTRHDGGISDRMVHDRLSSACQKLKEVVEKIQAS
jgi:ATP-dependent DNA helicase RecG